MNQIMDFMSNKFSPTVEKFGENPWVSSVQESMLTGLPLIFVGSIVTMISILNQYFVWMPNFSPINTFSFGMFGLVVSFMIPYFLMGKKGHKDKQVVSGLTSLVLYLILISPEFLNGDIVFPLNRFGSEGMFTSIVCGLFVSFIMNLASAKSFFDDTSMIP